MSEIIFDANFPDTIRTEYERVLNNAAPLLPLWLQRLYVGWDFSDKTSTNYIHVDKDYRFARLTVCAGWIDSIPERRQESIYHEIIHCFTSPVADFAREIIDICRPEKDSPETHEILSNELRRKCEAITQDFAYSIAKFNESKGNLPN